MGKYDIPGMPEMPPSDYGYPEQNISNYDYVQKMQEQAQLNIELTNLKATVVGLDTENALLKEEQSGIRLDIDNLETENSELRDKNVELAYINSELSTEIKSRNLGQHYKTIDSFIQGSRAVAHGNLKDFLSETLSSNFLVNSTIDIQFEFDNDESNINFEQTQTEKALKFRCENISLPNVKRHFTSFNFNGRKIEVEQSYDYDHDINLTIISDSRTELFIDLYYKLFFKQNEKQNNLESRDFIIIYSNKKPLFILNGFKIKNISGMNFNSTDNNLNKIDIQATIVDFYPIHKDIYSNYDKIKSNENTIDTNWSTIQNNEFMIEQKTGESESIQMKIEEKQYYIDKSNDRIKEIQSQLY